MQLKQIPLLLVMLLLTALLTSCSNSKTRPVPIQLPEQPILPRPTPIEPAPVKIKVFTTKTVMKWVKSSNNGDYLYAIDEQSYMGFAQWILDIKRFIAEQNVLLNYYETPLKNEKKEDNSSRESDWRSKFRWLHS